MKHFYTEIENITLVFDDIKTNQDGMDSISLHFEKPIEDGFAFLDTIPWPKGQKRRNKSIS
ncbi:hypothetical protein [uncultured Megasphaera sp.]|uniref:hypothetical protein n=1 Tax=uncultured Megasphaera sp. TaxID=165188 RepID=UPI002869554D|nr:hypothetical protein [uncultured Megasphaera sp.]